MIPVISKRAVFFSLGVLILAACGQSDLDGTWTLEESTGEQIAIPSRFSISGAKFIPANENSSTPCEYGFFKTPSRFSVSTPKPADTRCTPIDQSWDLEQPTVGKIVLKKDQSRAVFIRLSEKQSSGGGGVFQGMTAEQLVIALKPNYEFSSKTELPISSPHSSITFSNGTIGNSGTTEGAYCELYPGSDFYSIKSIPVGAKYKILSAEFGTSSYYQNSLTIGFVYSIPGRENPIHLQMTCYGASKSRITGTELEATLGNYFTF